ncbi:PREDICTED: chondroitin proteoglycan 1-like [Papilio xuthus]|uniref:Chondroitin proteoglycan 1-like n=1 Tax=Papilio xuthus TaxID=66420 RepID=A0AAJ6Z7B9_PAPXU|nr:PREDICTED: chondroitin proteoglycan 1-like [Papilio xuthus]
MLKETLFILFFALCTRVNSEVNLDKKHSYTNKPENYNNHSPLLTVETGNPIHLTMQEQNNNFYLIPILKPKLNVQTVDIHQYDPDTNILKTIIIVPPKNKKPCDRNSSISQPPNDTEKPTTRPCDNNTTTEKLTTTIKTTTIKPCELTTKNTATTPSNKITTPATKLTPNPNEITEDPNEVTSNPNEEGSTAPFERTTPIIGDPDGSTKCLKDGVYRANDVTCDQYYVCIHGIEYLMDCPYGLVFNKKLKICDWLENVSDCKPPAFKDVACPDEGYGIDGNLILQFRYRDSCSQFIACHKRKARLLTCEQGYYFHEESSKCMNFRSNSNCRDVWYSY